MTPPKKRKHDSQESDHSDEKTTNPPPTRSDCLYFKDGNIVLIAQNTAFRVHKGLLSVHSDMFRDMFDDVIQPEDAEVFDGCSVVRLSDESEALTTFLKALYMIEPISHPENPGVYFPHVLRLVTKYLCNAIRRQALDIFRYKHFPDTLSMWDTRESLPAPEDVIRLARDIEAEILLPAAFYTLCEHGPYTGDFGRPDDVVTFCNGGRVLGGYWPNFLKHQKKHRKEPPCNCGNVHCRIAWRDFWETKTLETLGESQGPPRGPLLQFYECSQDIDGAKDVCWEAKQTIRKVCLAKREEIWNDLPKIFKLESWEKLRTATDDGRVGSPPSPHAVS